MKKFARIGFGFALVCALGLINGCGDDGGSGGGGSSSSGSASGDLAPSNIGGKTARGVITSAPNDPHWQIDFAGGNTGNYTHVENPYPAEYGTYSYTKTSPNDSTAVLHPNSGGQFSMHFHFSSSGSGTYTIPEATERGTFTMN